MAEIIVKMVKTMNSDIPRPFHHIRVDLSPKAARFVASALKFWVDHTVAFLEAHPDILNNENYDGHDWNDVGLVEAVANDIDGVNEALRNMSLSG